VPWNSDESAAVPPIPGEPWVYEAYAGDPAYKGRCVPIDQVDPASPFLGAPAAHPLGPALLDTPVIPKRPTVFVPQQIPSAPASPLPFPTSTPIGPAVQPTAPFPSPSPIGPVAQPAPSPIGPVTQPAPLPVGPITQPSPFPVGPITQPSQPSTPIEPTQTAGSFLPIVLAAGAGLIGYLVSNPNDKVRNGLLTAVAGGAIAVLISK
jgi:hypothetical protein